ncbi:MAG TPA: hypothetical protein VG147_13780 [Solirubrobacteraceae bacterium]|jgi:hypothetical protein|nr:hypothetical protein [Solirubrobacteraceae bacterium]
MSWRPPRSRTPSAASTTGAFDQHLHALAGRAQRAREGGDYEAITPSRSDAEAFVAGAADYIAAVEHMLEG